MQRISNLCTVGVGLFCGLVLANVAGCGDAVSAQEGPIRRDTANFSSRTFADASLEAVRPAAARAFRMHFRVDPETSTGTTLISRPVEADTRSDGEQVRDVVGLSPSPRRQIGELRMRQDGSNVVVLCRVQTQRLQTVERTAFNRVRGDDRPTETPIDREGGASPNRKEEWRNVGRDRKIEVEILSSIQAALSRTQPAGEVIE